jgi:hypothetical protein
MKFKSDYVSPSLTDERRKELEEACKEAKRTTFYDLSPEEVAELNEWTLERIEMGVVSLDWKEAVKRLGLEFVEKQHTYQEDEEGNPLLDENDKPVIKETFLPDHDFTMAVKVEGLEDYNGKPIPKSSSVAFKVNSQVTNRPRNDTNWQAVVKRMVKWALNGEPLIKDANGDGISEQHRCVAKVYRVLQGMDEPDTVTYSCYVNGIHPNLAVTVDTGKSNSGKDIFGSDPELVPPHTLKLPGCYTGELHETKFVNDRVKERTRACGVCESATKLVMLRMVGKNVNGSLGNGQEATENAHKLVSTVLPDMDDLSAIVHVFIANLPFREKPVTSSELTAALALWFLQEHSPINPIPTRTTLEDETTLEDAEPIRFDIDSVTPLLSDISTSTTTGRLVEWTNGRNNTARKKDSKQVKFAQVCRMIKAYFGGEDITTDLLNQTAIGKQDASKFYHFGGADRGPIPKKSKKSSSED